MTTATDTLPADVVLEKQILGLALGGGAETVIALSDVIGPGDFLTLEHGQIFGAVLGVLDSGAPVELAAVAAELRRQGIMGKITPGIDKTDADGAEYLRELVEGYGWNTSSARHYGGRLADLSARRRLIAFGKRLAEEARAPGADGAALVEAAHRELYELGRGAGGPSEMVSGADAVREAMEHADAVHAGKVPAGLMTGFYGIDHATGGMQPGDLWTVGAATSVGKTAFGHAVVIHVAQEGGAVLIVSAEMGRRAVANRHLMALSGVDGARLRVGNLDEEERAARQAAAGKIAGWKLAFFDRAATVPEIAVRARLLAAQWRRPLSLIVADHLQLLRPVSGDNRAQQIGGIAWGLKQTAMDLGCAVLMLSQLNREGAKGEDDRPPDMFHLKESGDVENHSNVVILLHQPKAAAPDESGAIPIWVKAAKTRDGPRTPWPQAGGVVPGSIELRFRPAICRFEEGRNY